MERPAVDLDELVEFWTLLDEDRELLVGKRGGSALAFAVLLKHNSRHGCFPRGRADVPGNVVEFLARQVGVEAGPLDAYEWSGSTFDYHRAQIRSHLGFRTATLNSRRPGEAVGLAGPQRRR